MMKTSIRDLVRREKWATAYDIAITEQRPIAEPTEDPDIVRIRITASCYLTDAWVLSAQMADS